VLQNGTNIPKNIGKYRPASKGTELNECGILLPACFVWDSAFKKYPACLHAHSHILVEFNPYISLYYILHT
jgi:hypothetical protein